MNVLMLIDALCHGGAETHLVTLACALAADGHRVAVLSEGGPLERELKRRGVACLHPPCPIRSSAFSLALVQHVRFLRRTVHALRPDVVHAHTRRTALLVRLLLASYRVTPDHDLLRAQPWGASSCLAVRKGGLYRVALPAAVVTAHAKFAPHHRALSFWGQSTVAVSQDLKAHLVQAFGVPPARIHVIPNGIDLSVFCPPKPSERGERSHLRLTFASRLDSDCSAAAYALLSLFDRWKKTARAQGVTLSLCIVGGGDQLAVLRHRSRGMAGVTLCGACDRMADRLRKTDVFFGVSRAALEAAACGCAVVLVGNEGMGGLLCPDNFERMARQNFCCRDDPPLSVAALDHAFLSLLDMTADERRMLAEGIRQRLVGRLDAERMARDTLAVYRHTLARHRRLRVLIGGYAGCGNLGDDAILRCLITRLQAKDTPILQTLPTHTPLCVHALVGAKQARFGVPCHDRRHALLPMLWCDAFLLGGGALLQNCSRRGQLSLAYYLSLALLARLLGRPWHLIAGGVGPLNGRGARLAVRTGVGTARSISVRDEPSRRLLISLGLSPQRIRRQDDPVLSLAPSPAEQAHAALTPLLPSDASGFICVAPRGGDDAWLFPLAAQLRARWAQERLFPLFFAFDERQDTPACRRLLCLCGVGAQFPLANCQDSAPERLVAAVFAASRGVIAGRLHALILARVVGASAVALPPKTGDPKLSAFANQEGMTIWRMRGDDVGVLF